MQSPNHKAFVRWATLGLPLALTGAVFAAFGGAAIEGCSSNNSNSNSADASMEAATTPRSDAAPPPIGVPVSGCDVGSGCIECGGVLAGPDAGYTFCTEECGGDSGVDCPTGTVCVPDVLSPILRKECLKSCNDDSDCSGGFICRWDVAPVNICWSPYPPLPPDAGNPPRDGGVTDAGGDAGEADASDSGSAPDASDAGAAPDADSGV